MSRCLATLFLGFRDSDGHALGAKRLLVACVVQSLIAIQAHAADAPGTAMQTVGGQLRVEMHDGVNRLTLNGKPVYYVESGKRPFAVEDSIVVIKKKFRVGADDVVLVMTNCGCSGVPDSSLSFVTVTPAGKPTVSESMTDTGETGDIEVKAVGDTLTATTVTVLGRRQQTHRYVFANGKLTESK